ncbi:MAG: uroporphyrinogen decarboxylase family protein [Clostridia bacterium]
MPRTEQIKRIKGLIDQYAELVHSEKNQKNMKLWDNPYDWNRDKLRGLVPSKTRKTAPFVVELDVSIWKKICNIENLSDYYNDPYVNIETQLTSRINHAKLFADNYIYTDEIFIWFGVTTELNIFGSEVIFPKHKDGWIKEPIIKDEEDLKRLAPPDFYKSGFMPKIHQYYEIFNELCDGKLKVMFPELARGPFCIAAHLRGLEDMLCDVLVEPDFVHKTMRFVTDAHKEWTAERNKFLHLGNTKSKCKLFNDEIDCPSISPAIYDELIFPYEKELAEYYGGVRYFHSCGNITPFLSSINKLSNLDTCHVGPWTSYEEADKIFGNKTALEICLHPMNDVMLADEKIMRDKLEDIIEKCKHNNFSVRADTFMPQGELGPQIEKIQQWVEIAKSYFGND